MRGARAWNERAGRSSYPSLARRRFLDPRDKVQIKYEMLRAHRVDGMSVSEASRRFGYSRESFYAAADAFAERGIVGLVDRKRGPRKPRKLTPEVTRLLLEQIGEDPDVASADLARQVKRQLGVDVHRRTVERYRSSLEAKPRRRRSAGR